MKVVAVLIDDDERIPLLLDRLATLTPLLHVKN
jgi:hypothetical protein